MTLKTDSPTIWLESGKRETAPNLCRRPSGDGLTWGHGTCNGGVDQQLHGAYAAWAEHHQACERCGQQDWSVPGEVHEVTDPLFQDGEIVVDGKVVRYARGADPSVLCSAGRALFERWVQEAARTLNWRPIRQSHAEAP